jgi:hypothetical protein
MDPTEVSTGSKKSQGRRMAPSREKFGRLLAGILETGEITARRDSAFSSTKMETNMKACGPWTKSMDKVLTGGTRVESSGESIPAIGLKTRSTAEEPSSLKIATDTMATGSTECRKERAE